MEQKFKILSRGYNSFDKEVLLIKDRFGYLVYSERTMSVFEYGSDKRTAENHFNELVRL